MVDRHIQSCCGMRFWLYCMTGTEVNCPDLLNSMAQFGSPWGWACWRGRKSTGNDESAQLFSRNWFMGAGSVILSVGGGDMNLAAPNTGP